MAAVPPLGDSNLEDPISDELIVQKWLDSTNGQSDDVAPQKKSIGVKSQDRGGQFMSPPRSITQPSNFS